MREKSLFRFLFSIIGATMLLISCETESIITADEQLQSVKSTTAIDCDAVIDFNDINLGTIVSVVSSGSGISGNIVAGSVSIYGENLNPSRPDVNHAMIFDTDNPTGGDDDLVVPGSDAQEVLIISEDLDSSDPDDDDIPGGVFTFDFSGFGPGYVDVVSFITIDNEEAGDYEAYDTDGNLITSGDISEIANNEDQVITVNANNVGKLVVTLNGSGAVDNFCLRVEEEEESGCTLTQGFWKNTKKGPFPDPYNRDDQFFLSDMSWQEVLKTAPKGNAYFQAAHQYIAAVLNVANGASMPEEVGEAIALGTSLFETYTPDEIGKLKGNNPLRKQFISINNTLDLYNRGRIGPGHCDDK